MRDIKAFIRLRKLQAAFKALQKNGFFCMTRTDCEGTGNYSDPERDYPSLTYPFLHSKMTKPEMVIAADQEEKVVEIIRRVGQTGDRGDIDLDIKSWQGTLESEMRKQDTASYSE